MARPQIDEAAPAYSLTVIGRHVEVTDAMKQYARDKVSKIERLHGRVLEVVVTMDVVKLEHRVDIVMKVDHTKVAVHASSESMYASVDKATDRLQRKLSRYKRWIHEHHARGLSTVDMNVNVIERPEVDLLEDINDAIEEENEQRMQTLYGKHTITKRKTIPLKLLTRAEAITKMDLSGDNFLIYRSEEDNKLKVIYRRRDASYGVIEPE
jgi:putative sigma-54 modulation protein